MFAALAREHTPKFSYGATKPANFDQWKTEAWPQVLATLGDWPQRVESNADSFAEFSHDGLFKQRWIIDVGAHASVIFQINYPENFDANSGEKKPAILCWHGHGQHGKEPVMGNGSAPHYRDAMKEHNYSYGNDQMAKNGFITFAIDWMNCGDRWKPASRISIFKTPDAIGGGIDDLHATMLGMTPLSINVQHGKAATDFACSLPVMPKGWA